MTLRTLKKYNEQTLHFIKKKLERLRPTWNNNVRLHFKKINVSFFVGFSFSKYSFGLNSFSIHLIYTRYKSFEVLYINKYRLFTMKFSTFSKEDDPSDLYKVNAYTFSRNLIGFVWFRLVL